MAIQKGDPMSAIFVKHEHLYPLFVGEMIAVGEETYTFLHVTHPPAFVTQTVWLPKQSPETVEVVAPEGVHAYV